jgi:hypothetical protein
MNRHPRLASHTLISLVILLLYGCGPSTSIDNNYSSGSNNSSSGGTTTLTGLGYTWETGSSGTTSGFKSVAFGTSHWVAVGHGIIGASTDGKTWTLTPENATNYYYLNNVSYGNNTFVAIAEGGILTSNDGVNWSQASVPTSNASTPYPQSITAAVYGNGVWVAVDDFFLTENGLGIWTSTDNGASWNILLLNTTYSQPTAIAYGNGMYVIVGYGGLMLTSPDGANWTNRTLTTGQAMMSITYAKGEFVAITNDAHSLVSTDGINWTTYPMDISYMNGVSYGGGIFLAVGALNGAAAEVSTDGKTWTNASTYLPSAYQYSPLQSAAYGNSTFVAAGDSGAVAVSH